jgi:hypothetical protein
MAAENVRKHLMLSLGQKGFGETILGLRLASELRATGEQVFLLAHNSNLKLLEQFGTQRSIISSAGGPLLQLYISSCLESFEASSIILSDYFTTTLFFDRFGLNPQMLSSFGLPIIAIDTWDSDRTSQNMIDLLVGEQGARSLWPELIRPICPVPFLTPRPEARYYASLPRAVTVPRKIRKHLHHTLGVEESSRAVLFCTAEWQHPNYDSHGDAARRCAFALPLLVADYLARLGDKVHLVHVGPQPLDLKGRLDGRYHWLPPLRPPEFDTLVASMDLVLSANMSATTIAKAMASHVPVFVLQNSVKASSIEEAEAAMAGPLSPDLRKWLEDALPLFPFALWPLGYYRLITPLLQDNPYLTALDVAEILDEERVEAILHSLLFDSSARGDQKHRQKLYLDQVTALPSGAEALHTAIETSTATDGRPGRSLSVPA